MRLWVPSLASLNGLGSGIAMSCGVGPRGSSDLVFQCRLATVAPIGHLAWEPPNAVSMTLTKKAKKKKKKKKKEEIHVNFLEQSWQRVLL